MPNVAEVSASVPAPTSPASSSSGEKARPVAGPPTSVTEPATTPSSGCSPKAWAMAIPRKFWTKQKAMEKSRKITTWMPPTRRSARLALMPIVLKKATLSTGCAAVSSCTLRKRSRPSSTRSAKSSPPTTAAGMFSRSSQPIRSRSLSPTK